MHTFIPHSHFDELSNTEKQELENPDSLIDYVKLMFLTDLGEGHMESFDQGKKYDLDVQKYVDPQQNNLPKISCLPSYDDSLVELKITSFYLNDIPILRRHPDAHIDFRGPPSHV